MGDILSAIFGGGSHTDQQTIADPATAALNQIKLDQAMTLLGYPNNAGTGSGAFMQPSDAYTPSPQVDQLLQQAMGPSDTTNNFTLSNYMDLGNRNDTLFNNSLANVVDNTREGLAESNARYMAEYTRAMQSGLDTSSNFISQIATPQIMQQMALQGLEGGGAVPQAIAKATAETSLPMWQQLAQMAQQFLQEQGGIQQAGQQQQAALYGQEIPTTANFVQSVPQVANTLSMQPFQQKALGAQAASTLFPLADYSRGLSEQDLLRRQGLMTTAWTGIPYTPTPTVKQNQSSQPLFNFFGQG